MALWGGGGGRRPVSQNNDPNSAAQNILTGKRSKLMFSIKKLSLFYVKMKIQMTTTVEF